MGRLLKRRGKGAWLAALATCASSLCGGPLAGQDPLPMAPSTNVAAPQNDLTTLYQNAFLNPGLAPASVTPPREQGVWRNPSRYKFYAGFDYLRLKRTNPGRNLPLTSTSIDLFWDDPQQQLLGAQNADTQKPPREGGGTGGDPLFPALFFPGAQLPVQRLNPNSVDINGNRLTASGTTEFLTPGELRMQSDNFDFSTPKSGYRPKIGVELPSGNRIEFTYMFMNDFQAPALVDNVAGAAFRMKQISATLVAVGVAPFDALINPGALTRFGMHRFGYLDSPFTILPGNLDPNLFLAFRGEDVRTFGGNSLFPHFPYNEQPQPTVFPGPVSPTNPLLPLFSPVDNLPIADPRGIRSSDIPREPTTNDFPTLGSFLFRDGEIAIANYAFDLQSTDLVYRRKIFTENQFHWNLELLIGLRWLQMNERFSFFFGDLWRFSRTTDPALTATPNIPQPPFFVPNDTPGDSIDGTNGQAAEETQVTLDRKLSNNIFGPQFGIDAKLPFWSYFEIDLMTKAGWLINALENRNRVFRGDGLFLNDYGQNSALTCGVIEGQFGVAFYPVPKIKLHAGYEYIWMISVGTAIGNLNLELNRQNRPSANDNVLWNGWFAGGEITF